MIPVVTVAQMRAIDTQAIGQDPAVGFTYMLKAGEGLLDAVRELAPDPASGDVAIICGRGNNGGDGFTVGTLLIESGYTVMCYSLCRPEELKDEAKIAFEKYDGIEGNFLVLDDAADLEPPQKCSLIIDAVLGTGIKGDPHGISADVIRAINDAGLPVLSVDTPSGLDNDTGEVGNPCVGAAMTVAMGFPKIGSFFYPGKRAVGKLRIKDLGYSKTIVEKNSSGVFLPSLDELKKMLPLRKPAGSKFDHGVAVFLCGSRGMTGSAALASTAALRTGCGMVHVASPRSVIGALSAKLSEPVLLGIDETPAGTPAFSAAAAVYSKMSRCEAACIGPGLSHDEETARLVRDLICRVSAPMVLDADGLNAFKGKTDELSRHPSPLIVTPHAGEWQRLFGAPPSSFMELIAVLKKTAADFSLIILYKGNPTIIASPDGRVVLSPYGNSGMATAGSGDVLSGIITSLLAQGASPVNATILGAFLHGSAGDAARDAQNEYAMIAQDIVDNIGVAIDGLL